MDSRANVGVFLGVQLNIKGYLYLNLKIKKLRFLEILILYENCFPYKENNCNKENNCKRENSKELPLPIPHNYNQDYDSLCLQRHCNNNEHVEITTDNTSEEAQNLPRRFTRTKCPPPYIVDF